MSMIVVLSTILKFGENNTLFEKKQILLEKNFILSFSTRLLQQFYLNISLLPGN